MSIHRRTVGAPGPQTCTPESWERRLRNHGLLDAEPERDTSIDRERITRQTGNLVAKLQEREAYREYAEREQRAAEYDRLVQREAERDPLYRAGVMMVYFSLIGAVTTLVLKALGVL